MKQESMLKVVLVAILAVFLAIVCLGVPAEADALSWYQVPSDGTATLGITRVAGVKIHPSGNTSSVYIYDCPVGASKAAGNLKYRLMGPSTNDGKSIPELFPAGDFIYFATATYCDITNCSAELYVIGGGVNVKYVGSSSYRGWDTGNNVAILAATTNTTITVSPEAANYLLSTFPSDWQLP